MSEVLPRDTTGTAAQLQTIYGLSEDLAMDIMAAAPYAMSACSLVDLRFCRVVEAARKKGALTPLTIEVLGDFVAALLDNAQQAPEVLPYLEAGFHLLGLDDHEFPGELDYQRALPTMRLLLPRLVAIQLESLTEPRAE